MKGIYSCGGLRISSVSFLYHLNYLQSQCPSKLSKLRIATLRYTPQAFIASYSREDLQGGALRLLLDGAPSKSSQPLVSGLSTKHCANKRAEKDKCQVPELVLKSENNNVTCESAQDVPEKEIQRRLKIGAANRGRIPWNKGRKHSKETRERIRKRTIEALSEPKVRKKMSECPRYHSEQSKSRISSSMKKLWEERMEHKRQQSKCYASWATAIGEAAKRGFHDQGELEWDSYEKMKADMLSKQITLKEDAVRAKELAREKAERAARCREEKFAKLAEERKLRKEKAEARRMEASLRKKTLDQKKTKALSKGLKLKARLTKFQHCKRQFESSPNLRPEMMTEPRPDLQKWDIELIKNERTRRQISLADQIKAVKNRKAEFYGILDYSFSDLCYEPGGTPCMEQSRHC